MLGLIKLFPNFSKYLQPKKKPLNNVTWKVKIGKESFLNTVFKHPKLRIVTQTLQKKHFYQARYFFWDLQFSVFKY